VVLLQKQVKRASVELGFIGMESKDENTILLGIYLTILDQRLDQQHKI